MLEIIFIILMFAVFGKILIFALKAAWGVTRILFSIVFLPLVIVGMFFAGFMYIALIALVVIGLLSFIVR